VTPAQIEALLGRAREAQRRAEFLHDLAREAAVQAMIMRVRVDAVQLSPVIEARLQLMLGRDTAAARRR
jgi:hypothetical protein